MRDVIGKMAPKADMDNLGKMLLHFGPPIGGLPNKDDTARQYQVQLGFEFTMNVYWTFSKQNLHDSYM